MLFGLLLAGHAPGSRHAQAQTVSCGSANLAQAKTATASSSETTAYTANLAVDGNAGTRWSSAFSDPQWIRVDLGVTQPICRVQLSWETAYGRGYQLPTSNDLATWTTIYSTTAGDGGVDNLTGLAGSGRYLRVYGPARATAWGYSLWALQVYASVSATATATRTSTTGGVATATGRAPRPVVGAHVVQMRQKKRTYTTDSDAGCPYN